MNPIFLLAPAPNMTFASLPSGSTYVSDSNAVIVIHNGSVPDQVAMLNSGCVALVTGYEVLVGTNTLADLYALDVLYSYSTGTVATVFSEVSPANDGTYIKTGIYTGAGNWTKANVFSFQTLAQEVFNETVRAEGAEATIVAAVSSETAARVAGDSSLQAQINTFASGRSWARGGPVAVATTSNITLSGEQTIHGFTTSASRALVAGQTLGQNNGIYVTGAGAWSRAADADTAAELAGILVAVAATDNTLGGNSYVLPMQQADVVVGTSILSFARTNVIGASTVEFAKAISTGDGTSLQEATVAASVMGVHCSAYSAAGVGPHWRKRGTNVASAIQSADGAYWVLNEAVPAVTMFGAVPGYSVDCTAPIQSCLDYVYSIMGGGRVKIPAGTYKTTNTLLVHDNTTLEGDGRGASIIRSPNTVWAGKVVGGNTVYAGVALVGVSNSSVQRLTVDHQTDTGPAEHGIIIDWDLVSVDSHHCTVVDCEVLFAASRGHYCIWSRKAHGTKILGNYVDGGTLTNDNTTTQEGIEVYGGTDVLVEGNTVRNVGNNCLYCNPEPSFSGAAANIRFVNNFTELGQHGFHILPGSNITDLLFSGNQIRNAWNSGIEVDCAAGITLQGLKFEGNYVLGGVSNVLLDNTGAGTLVDVLFDGNTFDSATSTGSGAMEVNNFHNTVYVNNAVLNPGSYGMRLINGDNIVVRGNRFQGSPKGALIVSEFGAGLSVSNVFVTDNDFLKFNAANAGEAGVNVTGLANGVFARNRFSTDHPAVFAIYVVNSSSDRISFLDNYLEYDPGSQNPVYRNSGTNPSDGLTAAPSASAATVVQANTLINNSSDVRVYQVSGTTNSFRFAQSPGSFTLTLASPAVGNEVYRYIIRS